MAKINKGYTVTLDYDEWGVIKDFINFHRSHGTEDEETTEWRVWDKADDLLIEVDDLIDTDQDTQ